MSLKSHRKAGTKATKLANSGKASALFTTRMAASIAGSGSKTGWKARECSTIPAAKSHTKGSGKMTTCMVTEYSTTKTLYRSTRDLISATWRSWMISGLSTRDTSRTM